MKRIILFSVLLAALLFSNGIKAQVVPNGGFENWSSQGYPIPNITPPDSLFSSSNEKTFQAGILSMMQVSGNGGSGSALELKTSKVLQDTVVAYAIWGGQPGNANPPVFPGGFPFTDQNVTGISADLLYSINANAPGLILVQFKKNGVPIGGGNTPLSLPGIYAFPISGSQKTFTTQSFTFTPALPSAPDTCVIAFAANNPLTNSGNGLGYPGDSLVVDNIVLTGTTQTVPDGNLDNWTNYGINTPDNNWTLSSNGKNSGSGNNNALGYQTADAYAGSYAIALPVTSQGSAVVSLGQNICNQDTCIVIPGMSLGGIVPTSLGFYYKYSSPGTDTAQAIVVLTKWNGTSRSTYQFFFTLFKQSTYTNIMLDLTTYGAIAVDSAYIEFDASQSNSAAVVGSLLEIDNVSFDGLAIPTGVFAPSSSTNSMNVYPSPSSSLVNVQTTINIANVSVLNTLQQEVNAQVVSISGNKAVVDLSTLNPGLYIIRVTDGQTLQAQKVIKQ